MGVGGPAALREVTCGKKKKKKKFFIYFFPQATPAEHRGATYAHHKKQKKIN
jgi:hypothetical protein